MKPSVDIIIVNWNAGRYLRACLQSVHCSFHDSFELQRVVVVDNASADKSAENLDFPELQLVLIRNAENRGFSAACNQGAKGSRADYLLFLNPDTVLFSDSLAVPIRFMERDENASVGLCGIQLVDEDGDMACSCSPFPTPSLLIARMIGLDRAFPRIFPPQFHRKEELRSNRLVDQIIGAFLLVRRHLFEQLAGFDERFFVYFDDVDLALRARQLGSLSFFLCEASARHAENKCSQNVRGTALFYYLRSRVQYCWKHFGAASGCLVLASTILLEPLSRVVKGIGRNSASELRETLGAYLRLCGEMPRLLVGRD
jgi:N-acetylglucosaminyl-diphospho-decaprenol L-rhamnosyltransferase